MQNRNRRKDIDKSVEQRERERNEKERLKESFRTSVRERETEDEKVERRWSKKERGSRRLRRKRKSDIDGRCAYAEERREGVNGKKGERNEVSAREMEAYVGPDGSERDGVSQARRMLLPAVARFWDRLGSVESGQSSGR